MSHEKITKDELEIILRRHALWLAGDLNGEQANFTGANLTGADLYGANLTRANFTGANLTGADLSGADLSFADLYGANFTEADLTEANFYGANITRANITDGNGLKYPIACPEEGSFIGFKKCRHELIVKLEIPEDALRCSATGRECRCSKAKVISITYIDGSDSGVTTAYSEYDPKFSYKVGETVSVDNFEHDRWNGCSAGIHFFITRQEAVDHFLCVEYEDNINFA